MRQNEFLYSPDLSQVLRMLAVCGIAAVRGSDQGPACAGESNRTKDPQFFPKNPGRAMPGKQRVLLRIMYVLSTKITFIKAVKAIWHQGKITLRTL
jgi:hypothetical protein